MVAHLVDYFGGKDPNLSRGDDEMGWALLGIKTSWTEDELTALRKEIESHGLRLEVLENFDPSIGTMSCWTAQEKGTDGGLRR